MLCDDCSETMRDAAELHAFAAFERPLSAPCFVRLMSGGAPSVRGLEGRITPRRSTIVRRKRKTESVHVRHRWQEQNNTARHPEAWRLRGAALGVAATGGSAFAQDEPSHRRNGLDRGDIAILRFLAAAELIEHDLWLQYAELGENNPPTEKRWRGSTTIWWTMRST